MAVYFLYRSHCNAPGEPFVWRFPFDTVLDWARAIWKPIPNQKKAFEYARSQLGGKDVWVFARLFEAIANVEIAPPESMAELLSAFTEACYAEEEDSGPHHLQVLVDDGSDQEGLYLFDDHFLAGAPGLTDFLLVDDWELPADFASVGAPEFPESALINPIGTAKGSVYGIELRREDRYNLEDLGCPGRLDGVRLPDLCRQLLTLPAENELYGGLYALRDDLQKLLANPTGPDAGFLLALRDDPSERLHWDVYSDWLLDRGRPPAGLHLLEAALQVGLLRTDDSRDRTLDRVRVTPHLVQVCRHEE